MGLKEKLQKVGTYEYILPRGTVRRDQREVKFFLSDTLYELLEESAVEQAVNASTLPGVVEPVVVMPDVHVGYGFPIGGVMATDPAEGGIISPGAIGYDINCLPAGTPLLSPLGYFRPIEEIFKEPLLGMDKNGNPKEVKPILKFQKRAKRLIKLKTELGYTILLTEDHPLITPGGRKLAKDLKRGEEVFIYPFKGVKYEEPEEFTILETVGNENLDRELRKRGLLPLTSKNPLLPYVVKILGYLTGDGNLGKDKVNFYGSKEGLKELAKEIKKLGFTPNGVYTRTKTVKRNGKVYQTVENYLYVASKSLSAFFKSLGAAEGKKVEKPFQVPEWIFKLPKWLKRLYLASLFGAEMNKPYTVSKGYTFGNLTYSLSKRPHLRDNAEKFLEALKSLLKEFGIDSSKIEVFEEGDSLRFRFSITGEENLLKFFEQIGFEYAPERRRLSNLAAAYIRYKRVERAKRLQLRLKARHLASLGVSIKEIAESLKVNRRFVERSVYESQSGVRIGRDLLTFKDFINQKAVGEFVKDRVEEIEVIPYDGEVFDFTVEEEEHNFVASNFAVSNCGVRLIATDLESRDIKKHLDSIMRALLMNVPAGVGSTSKIKLSKSKMKEVLRLGAKWAVSRGWGKKEDLEHIESFGQLPFADSEAVSNEAYERGSDELGTVGSGNHFVEVQEVEEIYDQKLAKELGFFKGQVMVMVHSGSRGLGHQVATDYIKVALKASQKYRINLPDPELACMPLNSPEGQRYWGAMNAAANYAFANRQILGWVATSSVAKVLGTNIDGIGYRVVYDHAHNIGKLEAHKTPKGERTVLVHRKGATRAFPPGHPEVPPAYRPYGQPVIIPGDMGRYSYLLVGQPASMEKSWGTSCHGAGRVMSRAKAKKYVKSLGGVDSYIKQKGLRVVARGKGTIMEEIPEAYKDVSEVIKVVAGVGIAKPVLRLKPLGTLKG